MSIDAPWKLLAAAGLGFCGLAVAAVPLAAPPAQGAGPAPAPVETPAASQAPQVQGPADPALAQLVAALGAQGVHVDPAAGALWIPVRIEVRDELLEYLLVGPAGATHESLFSTPVRASVLNAALLALGVQPGRNATWRARDPKPTEEELRAGMAPYEVTLPAGDGLELTVVWRQEDELFRFRVEDLLRNLLTGASMQRHPWIYLGSRMLPPDPRKPGSTKTEPAVEQFAADVYQNLINVSFFSEGYTLLSAALPECVEQTIWLPNAWLIPQRGAEVALFFSRGKLREIPPSLSEGIPRIASADRDGRRVGEPPAPAPPGPASTGAAQTGPAPGAQPPGGKPKDGR
jgi:hypothetical protein